MMNLSADQLVLYLNSPKALNSLNLPKALNSSNLPQLIQLTSTHLAHPTYPIHPNSPQLTQLTQLTLREAPLRELQGSNGHCPNSNRTPRPSLKRALWGTLFPGRLEQMPFELHFHCISAPNHPGKGSDPPRIRKCPFEHGQFFSK